MSITFQPFGVALSAAWFFRFTDERYGGEPREYRCARLKVSVCAVPMVTQWKKTFSKELADRQPEISLWDVPPQRLRAQWQLGIQNKTTNWISHHHHSTLQPSHMPALKNENYHLYIQPHPAGLTWAPGISIKLIGPFITSWSVRGENRESWTERAQLSIAASYA